MRGPTGENSGRADRTDGGTVDRPVASCVARGIVRPARPAFTMLELILVVSIIGVVSAIAVPRLAYTDPD